MLNPLNFICLFFYVLNPLGENSSGRVAPYGSTFSDDVGNLSIYALRQSHISKIGCGGGNLN